MTFHFTILIFIDIDFSIQTYITYIVHDLSALGVVWKIQFMVLCKIDEPFRFMNSNNPFEVVVHYFLIGGMFGLDNLNEFLMMSVVVCMVTYWIRLTTNHDIGYWVIMIYYVIVLRKLSTWEDIEFVLKSTYYTLKRDFLFKSKYVSMYIFLILLKDFILETNCIIVKDNYL